jgi:hypothetical protein
MWCRRRAGVLSHAAQGGRLHLSVILRGRTVAVPALSARMALSNSALTFAAASRFDDGHTRESVS